jgi:hypothetical protein
VPDNSSIVNDSPYTQIAQKRSRPNSRSSMHANPFTSDLFTLICVHANAMLRYIHGPSPALCSLLLALLVPSKETSQSGSSLTGPDYILTIITNMSIHPSPYHIHPSVHAPSQQIPPTSHTSARTPNQSNPVEFNPIQASVMPSSAKCPGSALLLSSCVVGEL